MPTSIKRKGWLPLLALLSLSLLLFAGARSAFAGAYPDRPVKIVVPYPPGGTNDILARILAKHLQQDFKQSFVVENRSGAGGVIGSAFVARAAPDGYTLLVSSSGPMATALALYKKEVPYDVSRNFSPISMLATVTIAVVANPKFPAHSMADVIRLAKAEPGVIKVALPAVGSMHHLTVAMFQKVTGTKLNMIPYTGTAPALIDLMGGQVDLDFDNLPAMINQIRAGQLRALAVADPKRSPLLPNVPSFGEIGLKQLEAAPWFVLVAPAGTPRPIVDKLNAEVRKILANPEMKRQLEEQGANPDWQTVADTKRFLASEVTRWANVVKITGVKVE